MPIPHRLELRDRETRARSTLAPGDIIGRLAGATLQLADARIAPAHAIVLRQGRGLVLRSLDGPLYIGDRALHQLPVRRGLKFRLTDEHRFEISGVEVPNRVLAIQVGELWPQELCHPVFSLRLKPQADIIPRWEAVADARILDLGDRWQLTIGAAGHHQIKAGRSWQIRGQPVRALHLPRLPVGSAAAAQGPWHADRFVVHITDAQVAFRREHRHDFAIDGAPAALLAALHDAGGTLSSSAAADAIWPLASPPTEAEQAERRRQCRRAVLALQGRLRRHGLRDDLVRDDGLGSLELYLAPGDHAERL